MMSGKRGKGLLILQLRIASPLGSYRAHALAHAWAGSCFNIRLRERERERETANLWSKDS